MTTVGRSDGQLVRDLTLAECYQFDPRPLRTRGYLRFRCPRHGGDHQQSLSVREADGTFHCHNGGCLIWGTVVEQQPERQAPTGPSQPRPEPPLAQAEPLQPHPGAIRRAVAAWKQFGESAAQQYARRRGIPDELAGRFRLGYWRGAWGGEESEWLTFPLRCPVNGRPVGVYGRNLHTDDQHRKARVLGERGLFGATAPGALPAEVVLVEGAFEALAVMNSPELPEARAVIGASARAEWFDGCRRLIVLFDDDTEGRKATERLVEEMQYRRRRRGEGPQVLAPPAEALFKQHGCKDLGELLARGVTVRLNLPPPDPDKGVINPLIPAWDEPSAWAAITETYHAIGELVPGGAIAWAEVFAEPLLEAAGAAECAWEAAYYSQDHEALTTALVAFLAAYSELGGACLDASSPSA